MKPLISIIIPSFNRVTLIGETLESVLAQTYTNWECIVVDDGSTDNTVEVVEKFCQNDCRFKLHIRNREPKGANTCRNIGFDFSSGEYIQFFDSDDLMHPDLLKLKFFEIKKEPSTDLIVCLHQIFPSTSFLANFPVRIHSINYVNDFVAEKIKLNTQNTLIKREIIYLAGLFDERLLRAQEVEFFSRVLLFSRKVSTINETLIFVRSHNESITGAYSNKISQYVSSDISARLMIYENAKRNNYKLDNCALNHLQSVIITDLHILITKKDIKSFIFATINSFRSGLFKSKNVKFINFIVLSFVYFITNRFQLKLYNSLNHF